MSKDPGSGVFKPAPSKATAKNDATTVAAWAIINSETAARIAKTERLRAERLAQEQAAPPKSATKRASRSAS